MPSVHLGEHMKTVESIIKRKAGTAVTFGATTYHFKPNDEGAHVAQVADEHADVLLGITEGYRLYKAAGSTKPAVSETPNDAQVLQGDGGSGKAGEPDETQTPAEPNDKPKRTPRRAS